VSDRCALRHAILDRFGPQGQWRCGAAADISETVMSAIVNGRREPTAAQEARLADALGCDVGEIFPDKAASRSG